jgi:hypothetical protein
MFELKAWESRHREASQGRAVAARLWDLSERVKPPTLGGTLAKSRIVNQSIFGLANMVGP